MCIPLSLFRLARITLFPLFSKILERLSPRNIFLRWPKCSGLFVFGDGNSTIILFFSLPEPNFSFSFKILVNVRSSSKDLLIKKFRYGPTASTLLKDLFNLIKKGIKEDISNLLEVPTEKTYGDFSLPCFFLAKKYKQEPHKIAEELKNKIKLNKSFSKVEAVGPYLNFFINKSLLVDLTLTKILKEKEKFGSGKEKKRIMVEFPSPNTNKPLHLGHLRNMFLGESLSRILEKRGNKVIRANAVVYLYLEMEILPLSF